jgi:hypothetical protein
MSKAWIDGARPFNVGVTNVLSPGMSFGSIISAVEVGVYGRKPDFLSCKIRR